MDDNVEVAAYYFPNFHPDARNAKVHGAGWTEWELVRRAAPRFPGHRQPRVPLWGYDDESDPAAMGRRIEAAADHGLDAFIFDWYWYDDGPFLQRALENGFCKAANHDRLKFAIMWANHNWVNIHPAKLPANPSETAPCLYPGAVTRDTFDALTDHVIESYFRHPSYWRINGCPYFSIYQVTKLIEGLGGVTEARDALASFRRRTRRAGFPDLHLNAIVWSMRVLPGETAIACPEQLLQVLGFDTIGSYVWVHHVDLPLFPQTPYDEVMREAVAHWYQMQERFDLPFYPNVTVGWDPSPRTVQSDRYLNAGYPFGPTISDADPGQFETALQEAKGFMGQQAHAPKIVTINAWNEWTEGSYLEPDTVFEWQYLEKIRSVFGRGSERANTGPDIASCPDVRGGKLQPSPKG